tara:strand:+ start:419 stop:979 length:561 start_codon:yes stop_codon:yes gene_type:complete
MQIIRAKIAQYTLKVLEKKEWESISIEYINKKLKLKKNNISKIIKNKNDLLTNINNFFNDSMIKKINYIEKSSSKDMIFEIFMLRYDLLNEYRKSILKIFKIFKKQPNIFIFMIPSFIKSIEIIAKSSNLETKGYLGTLKIKGLLIIYFSTFLIWVKDESKSLDKTMTGLDNYLNKIENILKFVKK